MFSHVKISSFREKAHLVFHWCLYNNKIVTEGSFSLMVSYMQCNKRKTKNTLQIRKYLASK